MHKRLVLSIAFRIVSIGVLMMAFPLLWAIHDNWQSLEVEAFRFTIALGLIFSFYAAARFRVQKEDYKKLTAKDGLAIVGLTWVLLSLFGCLPYYWSGAVGSFTDAFFETVSGFTTTGSTIITDIEALPRGILFWRSLTQWIGGMGIIVLFVALLPALGQKASQLFKAEAPGMTFEKTEPRIKETAKNLWTVYFSLSAAQCLALMIAGMSFFDSLCHSFATMATGGFSTKNTSIAAFDPAIQWIIIVFMFLAGINFILHYLALKGRPIYQKSEEFRFYLITILACVAIFTAGLIFVNHLPFEQAFRDSVFQVISILTSTGFVTADFTLWPMAIQLLIVMFMFMGGCGGSTAGGMKVGRILVSYKAANRSIRQAVMPNAVIPVQMDGKPQQEKLITAVVMFFVLFMFLFFVGSLALIVTEHCDLITALSASVSALSNIGPGLGHVGPMENFAWISNPGKWILCFLMLAGRLELYAILTLLIPATWRK